MSEQVKDGENGWIYSVVHYPDRTTGEVIESPNGALTKQEAEAKLAEILAAFNPPTPTEEPK